MIYHMYELTHAAVSPIRAATKFGSDLLRSPLNPAHYTVGGRATVAALDVFNATTNRYDKPEWGLDEVVTQDGMDTPITYDVVLSKPFCDLLNFRKLRPAAAQADRLRILLVAPMSGHYATLLRGTVEALLPHADVYITDWKDARLAPLSDGKFDLEDYTDYLIEFMRFLGPDLHVMAICQPSVPVLMATAVMNEDGDPLAPASITLMGGPIDTRINPQAPNEFAAKNPLSWFEQNVITRVPMPHPGFMRAVYPGFLQLSGFMAMNLDRHVEAHINYFHSLVKGDGDGAQAHRAFYDEYLSVMDLTAEFYLQTVDRAFKRHLLPKGEMPYRSRRVDCTAITRTAMMTVEGKKDDISGPGQTEAAHRMCSKLPDSMRDHYLHPSVGHYGVFNGSRFRKDIVPRVLSFMTKQGERKVSRAAA